jgi:hypothetical protein
VNKHNLEYKAGIHSHYLGVNQFSDGTRPGMGLLQKPYISSNVVQFYDASDKSWAEYKVKFDKNYTLAEEPQR